MMNKHIQSCSFMPGHTYTFTSKLFKICERQRKRGGAFTELFIEIVLKLGGILISFSPSQEELGGG